MSRSITTRAESIKGGAGGWRLERLLKPLDSGFLDNDNLQFLLYSDMAVRSLAEMPPGNEIHRGNQWLNNKTKRRPKI